MVEQVKQLAARDDEILSICHVTSSRQCAANTVIKKRSTIRVVFNALTLENTWDYNNDSHHTWQVGNEIT